MKASGSSVVINEVVEPASVQSGTEPGLAKIEAGIKKLIEATRNRTAANVPVQSRLSATELPENATDADQIGLRIDGALSGQRNLRERIGVLTVRIEQLRDTVSDLGNALDDCGHRLEILTTEKSLLAELKVKAEESARAAVERSKKWEAAATEEILTHAGTQAECAELQKRVEALRLEIERKSEAAAKTRQERMEVEQARIENLNRQFEEITRLKTFREPQADCPDVREYNRSGVFPPPESEQVVASSRDAADLQDDVQGRAETSASELTIRLQQLEEMVRALADNNRRQVDEARKAGLSPSPQPVTKNQAYPRLRDVIIVSLCSAAATLFLMLCMAFFIARNSVASTDYVIEQRPNNNRRRSDEEGAGSEAGSAVSPDTPFYRLLGGARVLMEQDRKAILTVLSAIDGSAGLFDFSSYFLSGDFVFKARDWLGSKKSALPGEGALTADFPSLSPAPPTAAADSEPVPVVPPPTGESGASAPPVSTGFPADATHAAGSESPPVTVARWAETGDGAVSKDWVPPPSSGIKTTISERAVILQREKRAAVHLGPFDAVGSLQMGAGYNNNLYLDNQPAGSWQIFVQPSVKLLLESGRNVYSLGGSVKQNSYPDSTINDYLDRFLETRNWFDFGARHKLDLTGDMSWAHNMFGQYPQQSVAFSSQGVFAFQAPIQFHDRSASAKYTYGALTARGNLEFRLGYKEMRYDNYPDLYQPLSRNDTTTGITFYYRIQPKTKLLAEFNNIHSHYPYNPPAGTPNLDSNFRNYLLGVTWRGTAKTTGTIKLGYVQKEFVNPTAATSASSPWATNVSAMTWHVGVDWEPFRYSGFSLYSSQNLLPSWSLGSTAMDVKNTHVDWHHAWTPRIESKLSFDIGSQTYVGTTPALVNNLQTYGAEVNYQMHRWLRVGASYMYTKRDSSQSVWTGDQNVIMLNVMLTPP
ncbi:outer membrane beta-barrel protein [Candidatus Methylospira mobilis]|uniref:outer membrane beta-barrel protein n=1 Tax=Candidatus Methylospira mobilis TaxID=1808979 RepID=UPI0028EDF6A9|nr:outer membrane beta-barrel protein [Candidatus Methylospira mobilis]WNV03195.1 outer membrane beta-barrel protein [Candidatus Methylospira mobilis]